MVSFVARRLLHSIPVVLLVTLLVFVVVHASGDPLATLEASPGTSEATLRRIVERNHLDEPVLAQYGRWLRALVTEGFGTTLVSERTIWFRPSTGTWYVHNGTSVGWGTNGDIPVPGNYDGNATTDIAVFRPSTGTWFVRCSIDGLNDVSTYGLPTDIPLPLPYAIRQAF